MDGFGQNPEVFSLSQQAAKICANALQPGTNSSYKSAWGKWDRWCSIRDIDPIRCDVQHIGDYLTSLFDENMKYKTINLHRSAISRGHNLINGTPVGQNRLLVTLMRGIFNTRPPVPRYQMVWDVDTVLSCIASWGSNDSLTMKLLTCKLTMLLALTSAGRCSELQSLDTRYMKQGISHVTFQLHKLTKTCNPKNHHRSFTIHKSIIQPNICVVECLNHYLERTQSWRKTKPSS
ncbi:hypothetical protein KUTeg_008567 [Tegillarca granosa]|uniref:Uncharacterized protein n=1 Tax=Tegillarca granosa TaxID=220873 RepID=A0ABQ9FCQ4_TEGGR|nr:hypothetical protein KUTeg_008567 [Tegillarca granosa]